MSLSGSTKSDDVLDLVNELLGSEENVDQEEASVDSFVDELMQSDEDEPEDTKAVNTAVKSLINDLLEIHGQAPQPNPKKAEKADEKLTPAQRSRLILEEKKAAQAKARAEALQKIQAARALGLEKAAQAARSKQEALAKAKENQQAKLKAQAETRLLAQSKVAIAQKTKLEYDIRLIELSEQEPQTPVQAKAFAAQKARLQVQLRAKMTQLEKLTEQADALFGNDKRAELAEELENAVELEFGNALAKQVEKQLKPLLLQGYALKKRAEALNVTEDTLPLPLKKQFDAIQSKVKKIHMQAVAFFGPKRTEEMGEELVIAFEQEMAEKEDKQITQQARPLLVQAYKLQQQIAALREANKTVPATLEKQAQTLNTKTEQLMHQAVVLFGENLAKEKANALKEEARQKVYGPK